VRGDRFGAEDAMFLQAVYHAQTRFVQAVVFVGFVLGGVDVEPGLG
jgi:hypothetical protein